MSVLRITLFGNPRISHGKAQRESKITRSLQALFAYLLLQGKNTHPRETLAALFWAEHSQMRARNALNTRLWRLRRLLEPRGVAPGTFLITNAVGDVGFNWDSEHWLDVEIFEQQVRRIVAQPVETLTPPQAAALTRALELCTGELLEGFYDDWILRERERLRLLYLKSLAHLMRYHQLRAEYEPALQCANEILVHDPLREEIHRELMRLYLANGQRANAVRQYEICRAVLAAELSIAPMPETTRLYRHLLDDTQDAMPLPVASARVQLHNTAHELHAALRALDQAREQLQQAVASFEALAVHPERARRNGS